MTLIHLNQIPIGTISTNHFDFLILKITWFRKKNEGSDRMSLKAE